ncbi:rhomboid family intramembrane serine protease [Candidatus Fermentibacteria bacterium]|nr:rhomboid family intramembrane serine protease [Candidatus Fermentibacteria bacterium]
MIPLRDTVTSRHPPIATWTIILLNTLVFMVQLTLPPEGVRQLFYLFGMVPARFTHPAWAEQIGIPVDTYWPFLTSMFLHGGLGHILMNMWALWIFGDNVEDRMGPIRFTVFYLVTGLVAGIVHCRLNPTSTLPTVGASGAIAGVMGAYLVLYPRARVITIIPLFFWFGAYQIPAVVYLGFWFLLQLISGAASLAQGAATGGVAWWAHLGGFAAGAVLHRLFLSQGRRPRRFQADEAVGDEEWRRYFG